MSDRPVLACITAQPHCTGIVNAAKRLAEQLECELVVVTVQPQKADAESRAESVKCLKKISNECDVDIIIRYSDNPAASIATQAAECDPVHIFMGEDNGFLCEFSKLYGVAPISIVADNVLFTIPAECDLLLAR